jgi:hypothetical protein
VQATGSFWISPTGPRTGCQSDSPRLLPRQYLTELTIQFSTVRLVGTHQRGTRDASAVVQSFPRRMR